MDEFNGGSELVRHAFYPDDVSVLEQIRARHEEEIAAYILAISEGSGLHQVVHVQPTTPAEECRIADVLGYHTGGMIGL